MPKVIRSNVKKYVKPLKFASEDEYEMARLQLVSLINKHKPHLLPTKDKASGRGWEIVASAMYDETDGMLRGHRELADYRNFRKCFVEKVFVCISDTIVINNLAKKVNSNGILQLKEIGDIFFNVQRVDEMKKQKKKDDEKKKRRK